ncbi:MAG: undecaprenyl-diphosphate phosphatase [Candidatus Eisenbacteria sp.]|nr:undecaprenyl-diphosphate phosphatase [Candidatus Eisenbacteria bacterium]
MTYLDALILGLIQGLTEFLPVSSSGHLVIAKAIFGVETSGASLEVLVHLATVCSVLTMIRGTLRDRIVPGIRLLFQALGRRVGWGAAWEQESFRLVALIVWGTVPGAVAGLLLGEHLDRVFSDPRMALMFLLVTGVVLQLSRIRPVSERPLGFASGTLVGLAQAVAVFPGISRSGMTITMGLARGLNPKLAAEFSFLLLIPVVLGAGLVSFLRPGETGMGDLPVGPAILGFLAAYISGCLAVWLIMKHIRKGMLHRYSYYCWAIGCGGLVLLQVM